MCLSAYNGCSFSIATDMGASGADKVDGADSLEKCLAACITAEKCLAVEYSDTLGCWMHTKEGYDDKLGKNDGVSTYALKECTSTGPSTTSSLYCKKLIC